ncbi:MAG: sugar ABC transporter permease [Deltaproteobacteria bacterium]|nr:sugar ABC transporter permease [Candidatus Zymogenaceae bacterium]
MRHGISSNPRSDGAAAALIIGAVGPVLLLVLLLSVIPMVYNIYISATNMSLYHYFDYEFVGLENYRLIFTSPVSDFGTVSTWNVIYALLSIGLPFIIGVTAAGSLKRIPRAAALFTLPILILPWVIPAFITVLIWKGLFNYHFGLINLALSALKLPEVPWLLSPQPARIAVVLVSTWLGIPFMTLMAYGILHTIPNGIYEAARIDGAAPFRTFASITLPLVFRRMLPVLVLGFSAAFNNFTVIYLLTAGGPMNPENIGGAGATDIIISHIFGLTLMSRRYGLAAAYAVIVFVVVALVTAGSLALLRKNKGEAF